MRPSHAVDVTEFFEVGMASLREHAAYLEALGIGDPAPFMRGFMEPAGAQLGCELAIAFDVVLGPGARLVPDPTGPVASRELSKL